MVGPRYMITACVYLCTYYGYWLTKICQTGWSTPSLIPFSFPSNFSSFPVFLHGYSFFIFQHPSSLFILWLNLPVHTSASIAIELASHLPVSRSCFFHILMCCFWFLISWSLFQRPALNCCNLSWANVACHMLNYLFFKKASTWSILFGLHTYMALYFPICASCIIPIRLTQMQEAVVFVFLHLCQLFSLDNKICYFASNSLVSLS